MKLFRKIAAIMQQKKQNREKKKQLHENMERVANLLCDSVRDFEFEKWKRDKRD